MRGGGGVEGTEAGRFEECCIFERSGNQSTPECCTVFPSRPKNPPKVVLTIKPRLKKAEGGYSA